MPFGFNRAKRNGKELTEEVGSFFGILPKNKKKICKKCNLHFKSKTARIHLSNRW